MTSQDRASAAFRRVVAWRAPILIAAALATVASLSLAARISSDAAIGRLLVPGDPDIAATAEFRRVFPEGQSVLLLLEAGDPFAPAVVEEVRRTAEALRAIPGVTAVSALDVFQQAHPGTSGEALTAAFRRFATGTTLLRRQGLVGDHFLGIVAGFEPSTPAARDAALAAIDAAVDRNRTQAVRGVRRVGAPYLESWIEREASQTSIRSFPLFGLLVVAIVLFLYRSWRSLAAILLALGVAVALAVGAGGLLGFSFTVVSALVPLTVMVTTVATLVYLHSRFVDQPPGTDVDAHQIAALTSKLLPVTVSSAAAVLGFAALAVSPIRPIREMGIWTAAGIGLSWLVAFTVFPALQKVLRTPTGRAVPVRARLYDRVAEALPGVTWRWRWPLVTGALALSVAGLVALLGLPGRIAPMKVGLDALDYVDPSLPIHRDLTWFRENVSGLDLARVWVEVPAGSVTGPEVLRGLERFSRELEQLPGVGVVVGPTSFLRMRSYLAGRGEQLPDDPQAFARAAADLEQLLLVEPALREFVDVASLSSAQITVTFDAPGEEGYLGMRRAIQGAWDRAAGASPGLAGATMQVVGEALLQAKVGASLVPTLTESFALTAGLIFLAFLAVFRSPAARLLAMIPSVFAILVTFLGMRLAGAGLNVATILIATTVLGTTENDQIHFFHHLHEGEGPGGFEGALRHTLRVSGRAILFATLINAGGFLGLALSAFPPVRQFGTVTAGAFLAAMVADFTALPAALWILRRARPREAR